MRNLLFILEFFVLSITAVGIAAPVPVWAALSARADVSDTEVFIGQPFTLQITVSGSDSPKQPDLSSIKDFNVKFEGGSQNSSSRITIINGRIEKHVSRGYVFSYTLTPISSGKHVIGPISVEAGGETAFTRPISIFVKKAGHSDDFRLEMSLSSNHCYVGEPVILTVTWYLSSDVRNARFTIPVLEKNDMFYIDDPVSQKTRKGRRFRLSVNNGEVIGFQGSKEVNGRTFTTISFQKVLIPKKAGTIQMEPSSVVFSVLAGYRQNQSPFGNDFFFNFFNNSGFGRQGIYKQMAVASPPLDLTIEDIPSAGRPADFSGLVGNYRITASADPVNVSVGDPITLKIRVSGPDYLKPVDIPPLSTQKALARDFKIPSERAPGKIEGKSKVFIQTIRPMRAGIKAIPPISLTYFDTDEKRFKTAETSPIPITVKPARMITAKDIKTPAHKSSAAASLKSWNLGIAANYEDDTVLENQVADPVKWVLSPQGIIVVAGFPLFFILFSVCAFLYERKKADPLAGRAKSAGKRLSRSISAASRKDDPLEAMGEILSAFKNYLGDKFRIPAAGLTIVDVEARLREKGAAREVISDLKALFSDCEAARYGGKKDAETRNRVVLQAKTLAKRLEKIL